MCQPLICSIYKNRKVGNRCCIWWIHLWIHLTFLHHRIGPSFADLFVLFHTPFVYSTWWKPVWTAAGNGIFPCHFCWRWLNEGGAPMLWAATNQDCSGNQQYVSLKSNTWTLSVCSLSFLLCHSFSWSVSGNRISQTCHNGPHHRWRRRLSYAAVYQCTWQNQRIFLYRHNSEQDSWFSLPVHAQIGATTCLQ